MPEEISTEGMVAELLHENAKPAYDGAKAIRLSDTAIGRRILSAAEVVRCAVVVSLAAKEPSLSQRLDDVLAASARNLRSLKSNQEWFVVWWDSRIVLSALVELLDRLPAFTAEQLTRLVKWACGWKHVDPEWYPVGGVIAAIKTYATRNRLPDDLAAQVWYFGSRFEGAWVGHRGLQMMGRSLKDLVTANSSFGVLERGSPSQGDCDSPHEQNKAGRDLLAALLRAGPIMVLDSARVRNLPAANAIFSATPADKLSFVHCAIELLLAAEMESEGQSDFIPQDYANLLKLPADPKIAAFVVRELLQAKLSLTEVDLERMLARTADMQKVSLFDSPHLPGLVRLTEEMSNAGKASEGLLTQAQRLAKLMNWAKSGKEKGLRERLEALGGDATFGCIQPGEAWSDRALADLKSAKEIAQARWAELVTFCQKAPGSSPSAKWSELSKVAMKNLGFTEFKRRVLAWFPLVDQPRTQEITDWSREYQPDPNQLIIEPHADILKGLVWCCTLREDKEIARALTALALSAYRKVPKIGPRAVKIGNACVYALGAMPGMEGVGQLALLKVRVKFGTAQKMIEKALEATAQRVGLPREELEEMSVPAYGLTEVGRCTEVMGEFTAQLTITGGGTELVWLKPDGKVQKSIPASVKAEHAEELKELQGAAKDIQRMLPAQRERIDTLFLQQKSWPLAVWRERYLDHPLVGVIARRLLWEFTTGQEATTGIWFDPARSSGRQSAPFSAGEDQSRLTSAATKIVDLDLRPIAHLGAATTVRLWHPIGKDTDEVIAWRAWLDEQQIQQPFKQAHREVYLLTDAERQTRTYSNRFAQHILRQHQFNALCAARGWKNQLQMMVDAEYKPATRWLPKWNLRAEFWIDAVEQGTPDDTTGSGVFAYLSTDQVRFYPLDAAQVQAHASGGGYVPAYGERIAEPLALEDIPPLVFSEVMRDVDLFVGVASVGNDPNWADGGPGGRHQAYWQRYAFGDLNTVAGIRKEVLQKLIPRLKIAAQCSLTDKFLIVKGSLRTYKIHLGSGNILMEPNDQHLCIVPAQSAAAGKDRVFLPFEGDTTLSVILSKAFLLADDAKIKDPTIVSQIKRA